MAWNRAIGSMNPSCSPVPVEWGTDGGTSLQIPIGQGMHAIHAGHKDEGGPHEEEIVVLQEPPGTPGDHEDAEGHHDGEAFGRCATGGDRREAAIGRNRAEEKPPRPRLFLVEAYQPPRVTGMLGVVA
jgi:hypothetical protein